MIKNVTQWLNDNFFVSYAFIKGIRGSVLFGKKEQYISQPAGILKPVFVFKYVVHNKLE